MALVQLYVVLAVGPIFFSLAKIDRTLLEAARDMGATPFQIFREIIAPLSLPGVAIGTVSYTHLDVYKRQLMKMSA